MSIPSIRPTRKPREGFEAEESDPTRRATTGNAGVEIRSPPRQNQRRRSMALHPLGHPPHLGVVVGQEQRGGSSSTTWQRCDTLTESPCPRNAFHPPNQIAHQIGQPTAKAKGNSNGKKTKHRREKERGHSQWN